MSEIFSISRGFTTRFNISYFLADFIRITDVLLSVPFRSILSHSEQYREFRSGRLYLSSSARELKILPRSESSFLLIARSAVLGQRGINEF